MSARGKFPVNREFRPCGAGNNSRPVSASLLLSILNSDNIRVSDLYLPVIQTGCWSWRSRRVTGTGRARRPAVARACRGAVVSARFRRPGRDARLSGFAKGGEWDTCPPSASLAVALEAACGPEGRCAGASRDEMFGLLRQWQALESRAAAGKLGVLRALIRDDDQPLPGGGYHGDLPEGWTKSLTHEVATALSMPAVSAEQLMWPAWNLEGRLPGVGALLAAGVLTYSKAKAVNEALQQLTNGDAAAAEAMILPDLPGQDLRSGGEARRPGRDHRRPGVGDPPPRGRGAEQVPGDHGPRGVRRGRRCQAATCPPDQTLAAHASVCARAQEYKESGAFPDDTRMDQYRVAAYLDLLNGITCRRAHRLRRSGLARRRAPRRASRRRAQPRRG